MKKIILVIFSAFLLSGCNRLDNHQPLSSHRLLFANASTISQTFTSHRPNLNVVSICLRNPDRLLTPLSFTLKDHTGSIIRSINFGGGNIDNLDCTKFQFDPVIDSQDQNYEAIISLQPDTSLLKSTLYVESHGGGDYLFGNAFVDGVDSTYDLHFKTLYKQDFASVFKESYQGFFVRLTQDPIFFIIYLVMIILFIKLFYKVK